MTSDVTVNSALASQKQTANSSAKLAGDFTDFLTLLTTQLQNQDPLSPMDSSEFTNQLVSFAGVEQQINSNKKLDSLVSMGLGNSFSSALNYVGLDINYLSSEAYYDGSTPVNVNYSVTGDAATTKVNIFNSDGTLVFSQDVSNSKDVNNFTWDGTTNSGAVAPPGTYSVKVDALDAQNKSLDTSTVVSGHVRGIETQNGSTLLLVGERAVELGKVINVSEPQSSGATNTTNTTTSS